jgi:hypothetical protein
MSTFDSNDVGMPGYFLPEDSQFRLKKLRDHIGFLSRLAQPRSWGEQQAGAPEVPMDELAICLEWLAEQAAMVLDEVSWPAQRQTVAAASDVASADSPQPYGARGERFAFGITLDQIDALNRLIPTILAHGDVVACSRGAELAKDTLPRVGQAIYDGMEAVRAILLDVEAQPLGHPRGARTSVGEERAVYDVEVASVGAEGDMPAWLLPVPTLAYAGPSHRMRSH